MSASATKEDREDPAQAFLLKWVVYPIIVAVAAIVAVGVAVALISPDWRYPSWLHAVVGLPAMGTYYVVQLREPLDVAFSWMRTKRTTQDASARGGGVATSIRGRKNVVQVVQEASPGESPAREPVHLPSKAVHVLKALYRLDGDNPRTHHPFDKIQTESGLSENQLTQALRDLTGTPYAEVLEFFSHPQRPHSAQLMGAGAAYVETRGTME